MQAGQYYHIYNRGINKAPIFYEDKNYDFFLQLFNKYLSNHIDVYAYCLMPNHFHFLIKIRDIETSSNENQYGIVLKKLTPLEKAFRDLFISYAKSVNKAYNRTGALFQARFKRRLIADENYLLRLIAYIHLNPVRSCLCLNPSDWKHSSYNALISDKYSKIQKKEIISWFGNVETIIDFHNSYRDYQKERVYLFRVNKHDD